MITEDAIGDFQATFQATNDTAEPAIAYFEVVVSNGSEQLTEMFCTDEAAAEVGVGETAEVSCFTSDDYTDDYDSVEVERPF